MAFRVVALGLHLLLLALFIDASATRQQPLSEVVDQNILDVVQELKRAEIIPTVIDDFLPSLMLGIEWHKEEADLGNTIKPKKVQKAPTIELRDDISSCANYACASNMTYTIVLTDPDAPSRDNPEWSEVCHWIATGVPITSASGRCREGDIVKASKRKIKEVMPYKPPGPPPKTGKHRYVFLAFVPLNGTSIPLNLSKPSTRKHWGTGKERHGVRQWAAENKLTPIAANFIYAQNKKQ